MTFKVIIPARYGSTRLPGKALEDIAGKPMIQHVYERSSMSEADEVIIATDDKRIALACEKINAKFCMTSANHPSGTDRLQEVVAQLGLHENDIVVNVQGDEPLIDPSLINQVANNLAQCPKASVATLCEKIADFESIMDPNQVKVVFDNRGLALYFSRAPIPWSRNGFVSGFEKGSCNTGCRELENAEVYYRHIGIYAYRVSFLHEFVTWPISSLEKAESLEQLRALSNGRQIHVEVGEKPSGIGIDTEADLQAVREIMR